MKKTSEVYQHLYHYTDLKGLLGIISSQSLWATHYKNLNDQSEIILFIKKVLPKILRPAVSNEYSHYLFNDGTARRNFFSNQGDLEKVIEHDTDVVMKALFQALDDQIYISSFCGEIPDENIQKHGKLSQWRAYGEKNGRFCIVFDTKKLEELKTKEFERFSYMGIGLGDIVYSDEKQKFDNEFEDHIDAMVKYVPALAETLISKKVKKLLVPAPYEQFLSAICRYKHFGFKEEQEVRIYAHVTPDYAKNEDNRKEKRIEQKGKRKIINLFSDIKEKLPITRIIVGPHSKKKENIEKLKKILSGTNIQLDISEIPFLD
jgi:hypothetical protein